MKYEFTTKADFLEWAREASEEMCEASTKDFISGLTENTRLTHIVQWLFSHCSFHELVEKIEKYTNGDVETFNTYNWCGNSTNILQGFNFIYNGTSYFGLQLHLGGDARCNYSDVVVFEGNFFDETEDFYPDPLHFDVDGKHYMATPSITSEEVLVDSEDGDTWYTCEVDKEALVAFVREQLA